jgi:hypothetical protein
MSKVGGFTASLTVRYGLEDVLPFTTAGNVRCVEYRDCTEQQLSALRQCVTAG